MLFEFEKKLLALHFENKIAENVPKIKDSNTYCILSHRLSQELHENPKIVYFKQTVQKVDPDEDDVASE